jgi:alpha-1,2-mannosyltransferase
MPRWTITVLAVAGALVGAIHGAFPDLSVYQYGGQAVLDGLPVYESDDPATGYPFTYPPFAAVVMIPLALLPGWLAAALWTGLSIGALAITVVLVRRALGRPTSGWQLAAIVTGALALEPVWQNLSFGQVNAILMLAVVLDLLRPESRGSGVLVGLAAGVKLTPLVFVVLLLLVGRRSSAARAAVAFLVTVGIGFAAMPGSSATYWSDGLLDADRVGPPDLAHNQSVYGAMTRMLDGPPPLLLWLVVAGPLALGVVCVAAVRWRHGDAALGTCLGAVAMLLASPVSWSHHWVWAVPVAIVLWERSRWAAAAWTAVFVARPVLWPPWGDHRELDWSVLDQVVGNAYLLAAVVLAGWAALSSAGRPAWTSASSRVPSPPDDRCARRTRAGSPRPGGAGHRSPRPPPRAGARRGW